IQRKRDGWPILNAESNLHAIRDYLHDPTSLTTDPRMCEVGVASMTIGWNGRVKLCTRMEDIGDVNDMSVSELWSAHEAKQARQDIHDCRRQCLLTCQAKRSLGE